MVSSGSINSRSSYHNYIEPIHIDDSSKPAKTTENVKKKLEFKVYTVYNIFYNPFYLESSSSFHDNHELFSSCILWIDMVQFGMLLAVFRVQRMNTFECLNLLLRLIGILRENRDLKLAKFDCKISLEFSS